MGDDQTDPPMGPEDIVVQLLRVLSDVDLEGLGEDLRRLDSATTRRAMTGASLLAEALTRATLGSPSVASALGAEFVDVPEHVPVRDRGQHIQIHDDETMTTTDHASEV